MIEIYRGNRFISSFRSFPAKRTSVVYNNSDLLSLNELSHCHHTLPSVSLTIYFSNNRKIQGHAIQTKYQNNEFEQT
jgi:hypothetical protein